MTMKTEQRIGMSLDDYLHEASDTPFELINGERIYKMPNLLLHSEILQRVFLLFHAYVIAHQWGRIYQETTYITPDKADKNWVKGARIPDMMLFIGSRIADYYRDTPDWTQYPLPLVPDGVIEIISHTDVFTQVNEKAFTDLTNGVQFVWLIVPNNRKAWVYTPDDMRPLVFGADGMLTAEARLPNFTLELAKVWA